MSSMNHHVNLSLFIGRGLIQGRIVSEMLVRPEPRVPADRRPQTANSTILASRAAAPEWGGHGQTAPAKGICPC